VKFHGFLRQELQHEIGYRTVVRWLHDNNFRLKVPQPWPARQDETQRQLFLEQLKAYLLDETIDIWYLDETGIEGDPRPRRRWAQKGAKIRVPYYGEHLRMNVTGMVGPRTGQFYALEFTHTDSAVFQVFLNHANREVKLERPRNILICDNATWHKKKSLDWGSFEPVFLPPYSPDLNPIERLWLLIKAEWFADFFAKNREQLLDRIDQALLWVINRPDDNQMTCSLERFT
jgi:transposase